MAKNNNSNGATTMTIEGNENQTRTTITLRI